MVPFGRSPAPRSIEADKTTGDKEPFCRSWVPDFFLGGRTSASAGQAAQFCLVLGEHGFYRIVWALGRLDAHLLFLFATSGGVVLTVAVPSPIKFRWSDCDLRHLRVAPATRRTRCPCQVRP